MTLPPLVAVAFQSPADQPALPSNLAARSPLLAIARAGNRIVAVGLRGHIVLSDDDGKSWQQANVPVSTDLLALSFPTPQKGWAVGHFGIVLHTEDGGKNWTKQFDGKQATQLVSGRYSETKEKQAESGLIQDKSRVDDGSALPFLDVMFENEKSGFVVGTFNRIFRTEDGGKTWISWMGRIDNPNELHFYAIRGDGNHIYIVGEKGKVWRLDAKTQKFVMAPTPYSGSLFGLVVDGSTVLVFGMRGVLLRSSNEGKTWERIDTGIQAGIVSGTMLGNRHILLAHLAGGILQSVDQGKTFIPVKGLKPMPSYFGVASLGNSRIGLAGITGVSIEELR